MDNLGIPAEVVSSNRILYTPSALAKSSLLHLQEIGSLKALQPHTSARSGLQSLLFFYVVEGFGELTYQGQRTALGPGSCVWVDCSRPYAHATGAADLWSIRWIHFYGPMASAIYQKYRESGGKPVFYFHELDTVSRIWTAVMELAASADPLRELRMNRYLAELLVLIQEEGGRVPEQEATQKREGLEEIRAFLEEHYAERITLEGLSSRFLISPSYLEHSFKTRFGMSVTACLQSIRITRAKRLLRFSDKSIEEIGYETGIGSPSYFSRVFKAVEGMTPSAFREQW